MEIVPVKQIDISDRKRSVNKSQPVPRVYKNESSIVEAMRDDEPIQWVAGKTKKRVHLTSDNMSPVFRHISAHELHEQRKYKVEPRNQHANPILIPFTQ
jgi:hypothetical protein